MATTANVPRSQGQGEKEGRLDVEQKEKKGHQGELDGERTDVLLQGRAAAFEGRLLGRIRLLRAEQGVDEQQHQAQESENGERDDDRKHSFPFLRLGILAE